MSHVSPGGRGEMIWHFNRAGDFQFACLIPGHFQAGMIGTIKSAGSGSLDSRSHEVSGLAAVERYPRLVRGPYKAERANGG
jgi:hypothetical protein